MLRFEGGGGRWSEYSLVGEERARDIVDLDVGHRAIPVGKPVLWERHGERGSGQSHAPRSVCTLEHHSYFPPICPQFKF